MNKEALDTGFKFKKIPITTIMKEYLLIFLSNQSTFEFLQLISIIIYKYNNNSITNIHSSISLTLI